jgi:phosphatidylinositol glycan class S
MASGSGRVATLVVRSVYGSEWATPKDAYLALVSAAAVRRRRAPPWCWPSLAMPRSMAQTPSTVDIFTHAWATAIDVQGVAHCFEKTDEGKVVDRFVIEPISANSLECMATGAKTCFKAAYGILLEDALSRNKAALPAEFAEAAYCDEFEARCDACTRTWMRPHAMDNLL